MTKYFESLRSLKNEILLLTLGLTILTIIATTALGIFSTTSAGGAAEDATSVVLRQQAEDFLNQIATSASEQQDLAFEQIRQDTEHIVFFLKNIYEQPVVFSRQGYWNFDTKVIRNDGRYINATSDISTFHIPNFVFLDQKEKRKIELSANLDFIVPHMLENNSNVVAIYTVNTSGVTRYFPNIVLGELGPPEYDPRPDIYYAPAAEESNPEKKTVWSPLYSDVAGKGLMITVSAPIYANNQFSGIVATDILLTNIIKGITELSPIEGSYAFLIDKNGDTIAFPDKAYLEILGKTKSVDEARVNLPDQTFTNGFSIILGRMMAGESGFGEFYNGTTKSFISFAPLRQTGFSIAIVNDEPTMLKAVEALHQEIGNSIQKTITSVMLPAGLFIVFVALFLGFMMVSRVVNPVQQLTKGVREIDSGNLNYLIKIQSNDEIGELAGAFNQMSANLKKSRKELEQYNLMLEDKIKERTIELTEANAKLHILDQRKSEFVSIVSHQLRTPITAIKGYSSLLLEDAFGSISNEMKVPIEKIFRSSKRLADMVTDYLDISKIEQGTMTYAITPVDIGAMVTDLGDEFVQVAAKKGLSFAVHVPPETKFIALADDGKIRQIFSNLFDNSIKYTLEGSVNVHVASDLERGIISVKIVDTGIGLSQDDIHHLFGKFARGSGGQKQNTDGSGLGLYVAKKMLEAQNGSVWVDSEGPGKGSKFYLELKTA